MDFYVILGVEARGRHWLTSKARVQAAPRGKYHPDINPGDRLAAGASFRQIAEAYETLSDNQAAPSK